MDAPEPRLWTGAPERQIGGLATTRQLGCRERRLSSADPPKVVPLAQQPSFVRVARYPTAFGKRLFCECPKPWQESVRQTNRMRLIGPILKASGNCRKIVTMA